MAWKRSLLVLALILPTAALAQVQSRAPADMALAQTISKALIKAGIDPRTTSVQVVVAADHTVTLKGLISNANTIKLAAAVAAKNAPGYRIVNSIHSNFFDDPNHVTGGQDK